MRSGSVPWLQDSHGQTGLTSVLSSPSLSLFLSLLSWLLSACGWLFSPPCLLLLGDGGRVGRGMDHPVPSPVPTPGCPCSPPSPNDTSLPCGDTPAPHSSCSGTTAASQLQALVPHCYFQGVSRGDILGGSVPSALPLLMPLSSLAAAQRCGRQPCCESASHPNPLILCILLLILLFLLLFPFPWCPL